jgi:hypothetical protein
VTPPRGILPRSVRERYHRSRQEREGDGGAPEAVEQTLPPPEPEPEPEPQSVATPAPPSGAPRHLGRRMIGTAGLVGAILAVGAVGIVVGSVVSTAGDTDTSATTARAHARTAAPARPPTSAPAPTAPATSTPVDTPAVAAKRNPLTAGGSYDPLGDGSEHADLVPLATDGDPSTAWSSEDYQALNKAGVGLYVNPKHAVSPTRLTITTPTPGFSAQVYGADGAAAPKALSGWTKLATVKNVKRVKAVKLDATARAYRHVLLWITSLPPEGGAVEVSELSLR